MLRTLITSALLLAIATPCARAEWLRETPVVAVTQGHAGITFIRMPNLHGDIIYYSDEQLYALPFPQKIMEAAYDPESRDYILSIGDSSEYAYSLLVRVKPRQELLITEIIPADTLKGAMRCYGAILKRAYWWNAELGWLLIEVGRSQRVDDHFPVTYQYELWDASKETPLFVFDADYEVSDAVYYCELWAAAGGVPAEMLNAPGSRINETTLSADPSSQP